MLATEINWSPDYLEDILIKLLPLKESDFDRLYEVASDPKIWEQHPNYDRYKREVFKEYFDGAIKEGTAFLIMESSSEKVIGCTRYYNYNPEESSIAIGFTFLTKEYWGGKFNRSSKKLLIDYAFQFVDRIYFHIGSENIRSQIATENIRAKKVREINYDSNGKKSLHFEYMIEKKDWVKGEK